jgi:BirA family biotin operon repressor/biotin-[acetyl-CoA-carboxylase] ligase
MPNLFHYLTINSTQDEAKKLLKSSQLQINSCHETQDFAIVLADEQTAGRGSYGKSWASPKGAGIYATFIYQINFEPEEMDSTLTFKIAELITQGLRQEFSLDGFFVKPINDIYYDGSKLAGILVETLNCAQKTYLLIGLGLNIRRSSYLVSDLLPGEPKAPPIALEQIVADKLENWDSKQFIEKIAFETINLIRSL